jgi:hypothetical protein
MVEVTNILVIIQMTIFALNILFAFVYSIPILLIRRFHNVTNAFTVNLCFAAICCNTYWLFYTIMINFFLANISNATACFLLNYFAIMCTIQVPLAVIGVSIYRLCSVVYHTKAFFRKKRWAIICIATQWLSGIILSLPEISMINSVRIFDKYPHFIFIFLDL